MSVDGFIEGPDGELDWAMADDEEVWHLTFESLDSVDLLVLGRGMYPAYEQYWLNILANANARLKREVEYAHRADKIPHIVLSTTLDKVAWKTTRIVRDVDEIRKLKQQLGKDMYVVGGATVVSSLMNLGLIDQIQLIVNPLVLGGGKALFKNVKERHALKLMQPKPFRSGKVCLTYSTLTQNGLPGREYEKTLLADERDDRWLYGRT